MSMSRYESAIERPLNGLENMARDAALLEARRGFRVYTWDGVWVSLGRFQSPDHDLVEANTTNWVRRPTGGKAVLHGHDVTVAIALSLSEMGARSNRAIGPIYRLVTEPLISALRRCGLRAVVAGDRSASSRQESSDCFASASRYDVLNEETGLKACGCALRVSAQAVLLQASIPFERPSLDPGTLIVGAAEVQISPWNHSAFAFELGRELNVACRA